MANHPTIDFTRSGWRQLDKVNHALGSHFLRAFTLRRELAAYIAEHTESGFHLDTECLEVRYEDGVYLLLKQMGGVWYITDVVLEDAPAAFAPVYLWTRIKRGASWLLAQVLIGWQQLAIT